MHGAFDFSSFSDTGNQMLLFWDREKNILVSEVFGYQRNFNETVLVAYKANGINHNSGSNNNRREYADKS